MYFLRLEVEGLINPLLLQLREGTLIQVPPTLVKRCKTHFHNLPCGATVILGNNGFIWISPLVDDDLTPVGSADEAAARQQVQTKEVSPTVWCGWFYNSQDLTRI